jgi:thiamine pyrophosphate-dependent acetolactate synthase large subunit-like protein
MNGMELITAVECSVPVIWIVEHNNMQGITHHASKRLSRDGKPLRSSEYRKRLDIAGIARAMGLHTEVVERPGQLEPVVKRALRLQEPVLIEVRVDPTLEPPLGDRAKSLAGFIER